MVCCWSGDDGVFNQYERVRVWGVYTTVVVLTPVFWYVSHRFYKRRHKTEMLIRQWSAVILCPFSVLVWLLLSATYQLTMDLEWAEADWESFSNPSPTTFSEIINLLGFVAFASGLATYLYRVLMFYFKSIRSRNAEGICEEMRRISCDKEMIARSLIQRRNPRKYVALCFLWTCLMMTPTIVIDFVLDSNQRDLKLLSQAIIGIPTIIFEAWILRKTESQHFGILMEYQMMLMAFMLYFAIYILVSYTNFHDTYYEYLIDFIAKWILMSAYFIWLALYLDTFSVEKLSDFGGGDWSLRIMRTKSENSSDGFETDRTPLHKILSNEKQFKEFRKYVHDTMCPENLLFFVDIYIHRKSLKQDPFLGMVQNETNNIRNCAMVTMSWIDETIEECQTPTPTAIYLKYIKPLSVMEVNIPGQIKKKIIQVFNEPKLARSIKERFHLELGSVRSSVTRRVSSRRRRATYSGSSNIPKLESSNTFTNAPLTEISSRSSRSRGSSLFYGLPEEPSIIHFYPAWKNLVNLLRSDSLIRFRNRIAMERSATA